MFSQSGKISCSYMNVLASSRTDTTYEICRILSLFREIHYILKLYVNTDKISVNKC